MQRQQHKRLYNVAFILIAICSFYFVFSFIKSFVQSNLVDSPKVKLALMFDQQSQAIYGQMVKAGQKEQADKLIHDPAQLALAIYAPDDENGKLFLAKYKGIESRMKFCEQNVSSISVVTALAALTLLYFLIWQLISLSTRYIKGHPDRPLANSHINN